MDHKSMQSSSLGYLESSLLACGILYNVVLWAFLGSKKRAETYVNQGAETQPETGLKNAAGKKKLFFFRAPFFSRRHPYRTNVLLFSPSVFTPVSPLDSTPVSTALLTPVSTSMFHTAFRVQQHTTPEVVCKTTTQKIFPIPNLSVHAHFHTQRARKLMNLKIFFHIAFFTSFFGLSILPHDTSGQWRSELTRRKRPQG